MSDWQQTLAPGCQDLVYFNLNPLVPTRPQKAYFRWNFINLKFSRAFFKYSSRSRQFVIKIRFSSVLIRTFVDSVLTYFFHTEKHNFSKIKAEDALKQNVVIKNETKCHFSQFCLLIVQRLCRKSKNFGCLFIILIFRDRKFYKFLKLNQLDLMHSNDKRIQGITPQSGEHVWKVIKIQMSLKHATFAPAVCQER